MTPAAIAASGLRKAFGDRTVLDGIDLDVREGTVFSLLGPNGAGKTTAVNLLTTLMEPDGGTVRIAGHDIATETRAVRAVIGVTGQFAAVDELLTGLDPRSRRTMWEIIRELVADGVTVFLTTQYLEEADQLADRIAVLDHGRVVAHGTPDELKRLVPGGQVRLRFTTVTDLDAAARQLDGASRDDEELGLRVPCDGGAEALRTLLNELHAQAIDVAEFTVHTPDLDDVFLALTGRVEVNA